MARGEARTREGEATLGSRSPRATGQPPPPVPVPTARCLGASYLGGGGGRAPGCGLRRSGGGGRASGGRGRAGRGQGPRLTGHRLPWHGRPAPGRSATSAAPAGKVAATAGQCGDVLEREGGGRREAAGGGTGGPRRRGRRRGAGGSLPPSSLPRCFPHSRPPSKPLSPPRPQVRGASCQAGRARRGEGAAESRRWAGGGEEGRAARPGERAPGGRGRRAAAEPRESSAAPSWGTPPRPRPRPEGSSRTRPRRWPGGGGVGRDVPPSGKPGEGAARGGGLERERAGPEEKPQDREDGGGRGGRGGGGPSLPSRGVTLAWPPAAPGGGEGGRNASSQALISPPSSVPGTCGQRPAGRGPGSGFGAAQARVRGGPQPLLPVGRRVGPRPALGLSFPWNKEEAPPRSWSQQLGQPALSGRAQLGSLIAPGPSAPSAVPAVRK